MQAIRTVVITLAVAGAMLTAAPGDAAAQVFLSLDGIDGESRDADHQGWIEVQSFSWGTTASGSSSDTPPEGVRAVTFTRRVDATSPRLAAARTRRISNATLAIRPAGSTEAQHLDLDNVRVAAVRTSRTTSGVAMETVTLTYEHIERAQARATTRRASALTGGARPVATSHMFFRLPDVVGESADVAHDGEIEILSWSWGTTASTEPQPESPPRGVTSLTITRRVDAASPRLSRARTQRTRVPEAALTLRRAGGSQAQYLEVRLQNVMITSYRTSAAGSDGSPAVETVTLSFEQADAPAPVRRRRAARRATTRTAAAPP